MGQIAARCFPGFSSTYANPLTDRLERRAAAVEASYRNSYLQFLLGAATLHDGIDAALADDAERAADRVSDGLSQLCAANGHLTALGDSLVRLRADLFEDPGVDSCEPLLAREPLFACLDYDGIYLELADAGAALPHRAFWDEVATRLRAGGARGGFRLLERHVRELQSDLHGLIAQVECGAELPGRALGEALHATALPVARVVTSYTRLVTTFGYVSICCERAMRAYEQARLSPATGVVLAAS